MTISPITKEQWIKVVKALAYAFASGFIVSLASTNELSKSAVAGALTAGVNALLVAVKQLFTLPE